MKKLIFTLVMSISGTFLYAQSLCFDPNADVRYEAGNAPNAVATGDFDEDNNPDVVAANYLDASVSVFLGNGDGTFAAQIAIGGFTGSAEDVKVGDFNGDQHDDILVCLRAGNNNLALITGNGDGTFNATEFFDLGLYSGLRRKIELADVDDDNIADVVYNVQQEQTVYMIKTVGNGTFTLLDSVVTTGPSYDISLGDINGDTYPDLAVSYQTGNAYVSYYLGNGDGSFGAESTLSMTFAGPYTSCVMARLDGDAHYDLVAECNTRMNVWKSDGVGGFTLQDEVNISAQPDQLMAGNLDNMGNTDIAWVQGALGIAGSLTDTAEYALDVITRGSAFGDARSGVLADFNNDGQLDMVTGCYGQDYITFLQGNGDGTFGPFELRTYGYPKGIVAEDFDGDNHKDIITANFNSSVFMSFMKGNGDGTFQPTVNHSIYNGAQDVAVLDVDDDNDLDIAIVTQGGHLLIEHNDGSANFGDEDVYSTTSAGGSRSICVGDFNNDMLPDVAFTYGNLDNFNMFINTGLDSFAAPVTFGTGTYPQGIYAADLNGDQYDDIVTANDQSNDISVHINNQAGGFLPPVAYVTGAGCRDLIITDLNNDQEMDIATVNNNSVSVSILLGNGNGTFQAAQSVPLATGSSPVNISFGLVNGDTEVDLVVSYAIDNQVALLTGNGNGSFNSPQTFSTDDNPTVMALADFNEDNALDISVINYNTQNVSVILNSSAFVDVSGSTQLCQGESVTLTASGGFSYLWSSGETTPSIEATQSGTYTVTITNQAGDCEIIPPGVEVTVNTPPTVNLNNVNQGDQCVYDDFVSLSGGSPQGGDYSGVAVVNGVFDPSVAGAGDHWLYYTYTDPAQCFTVTDSALYTVHPEVGAENNFPYQALCLGSSTIDLAGLATPSGGDWYIDNASAAQFDPQTLGLGSYELDYIVSNVACTDIASMTVEVIADVTAAFNLSADTVCMNEGVFELMGGSPLGGVYFGTEVSNDMFDPFAAGTGTFTLGYGYDAGAGCSDTAYADIEVVDSAAASITASMNYICLSDVGVIIELTGQPAGGTFFGPSVNGNEFDPFDALAGIHTVGYAYTNVFGCSDTAYTEIEVELCPGVNEIDRTAMRVYPNPARDVFTIGFRDVATGLLEVRDMLGKLVYQQSVNSASNVRLVASWPAGSYQLMLITDEFIGVERLVVTR